MNLNNAAQALVDAGFFNGTSQGSVANRLSQTNYNVNALRPYAEHDETGRFVGNYVTVNGANGSAPVAQPVVNATLRKDEWILFDSVLVQVARQRLRGINDLISRGLTFGSGVGLGATVLQYEDVSKIEPASISMDGINRGRKDRVEFSINNLPLPIIHGDWELNERYLATARRNGNPIDTTFQELQAREVAEKAEDLLFNGSGGYTYGGNTIYGYTTFPSRVTQSITDWSLSGTTGETILDEVSDMMEGLRNVNKYGPFVLYISSDFEKKMGLDFKSNSDKSIRSRLLELEDLEDIRVADKLASQTAVLVSMTSDTIRLVNPLPLTNVEWDTEGGMNHQFKVMAIMVPQPRADQDGQCGICHGSV